jgi:gag-polypeptide of LTR copia-type
MTSLPDAKGPLAVSSPPPTQPLHGFSPNSDHTFITETLTDDPTWPKNLILDIDKYNWPEWSYRIRFLADSLGLGEWLSGTLPQPDPNIYPNASRIWQTNDRSLRAFLILHISESDWDEMMRYETSSEVFEQLRKRHEKRKRYAQVLLMKQAFDTHFEHNTPMIQTVIKLKGILRRILSIGDLDPDMILTAYIVNALGDLFGYLKPTIRALMEEPDYTPDALIRLIESKEDFLKRQMTRNIEARAVQRAASAKLPRARGGKSHAANAQSTQLTNMGKNATD